MRYKLVANASQIKARKTFNRACKHASDCRHERSVMSCYGCKLKDECEIHQRMKTAKLKMQF